MAEELGRTLEQLTSTIQEQNKELKQKDSMKELDQSITALEKSGTENSARLRETLTQVQLSLDSATNEEQMELAREQLDALQGLAGTEEENRESSRRQEEANEFLSQLVSGIDGLADSYDKQLDAMKPSGGLLAGLGAVALLFMDPETLFAGVRAAIDGVFAIVDSIKMFFDGDFSEGLALLGENIGAVAAIVGTVAVLFGGRIIRLVGSLVKGVRGIIRAVSKVGRFIGALAGRFGGLVKIFGRLFLPFTIITGAIGAIQGAIDGFKEDGILGGLEGGISGLLTTIVGYPLDLLKSAVAWIAGKFGFENAEATLNEFSFSTLISDSIGAIFDMVKGAFDWIGTLFTDPVAALQSLWNGLVSGANWLVDIVYAPINAAINWISGLFGWGDPNEPFKLQDTISGAITGAVTWVKDLFTDPVAALEKLAVALLGVDGLLGVITAPIDKAIAWVQGLFNLGDPNRPFSLYDTLYTPIDKTITWLQGLFTDPVAALQQAWNGLVGEGGLVDILLSPVDKAIAWVQGLFGWGDPTEPFKITTLVKDAFTSAKDWIVGLFTWGSEAGTGEDGSWSLSTFIPTAFADVKEWFMGKLRFATGLATEGWTNLSTFVSTKFTEAKDWILGKFTFAAGLATEGWTNLKDFVLGKFTEAKDWFIGKLSFASDMATEGWTNLKDFASSKFTAVKEWFTGLFSWASEGLSDKWTNLTDFVKGKWTSVKTWFTGLFTWAAEASQENFILDLFNSTIEKVKTFFTDLFDFLPSFEDIKKSITGMLPDFLQPDSIEEQKAEIQNEIAEHQAQIAEGDMRYGAANVLSRENRVTELQEALSELEGLNKGGIVNAPASGGLAMLHGAEIVAPLNSPQGKVLMAINDLMNAKSVAGAGEYGGMGGPMIVQGGSNSSSNNTNNVSTSTYTIQQGITPDDFLKRDFVNFSY
jgi:hypothetical protein